MNSQIVSGRNKITPRSKGDDDNGEEEYEANFSKRVPLDTYDQPEPISVQDLLYRAACANEEVAKAKWQAFEDRIKDDKISDKRVKKIIHTLDADKHWAALHYAIFYNNAFVYNILTSTQLPSEETKNKFYCDVHILGGHRENVLHVAAASDILWKDFNPIGGVPVPPIITGLVETSKVKVDQKDQQDRTPLHWAVMKNRLHYAEYLIEKKPTAVTALTKLKANVLHFAFILPQDQTPMANMLLKNKDVLKHQLKQQCTVDNWTPLILAVTNPHITPELISMLINNAPDEETNEKRKKTIEDDTYQLLIAFEKCPSKVRYQVLHSICRYDRKDMLDWALDPTKGKLQQYINEKDQAGYTPFLTAVFYGATKCIETLLEQPNPNKLVLASNKCGESFLHICAKIKKAEAAFEPIWKKLSQAEKTTVMKMADDLGNHPLHLAARTNNVSICQYLLEEADTELLRSKNKHGKTACHEASGEGHDEIIQLIWQKNKTALFERDDDGYTCLHMAAEKGQLKVVEYLLKTVKIWVDEMADRRLTSLHLACKYGHVEIVKCLLEQGASTTFRNAELYNCLEISITHQQEEVVKDVLLNHPTWKQMMRNAQPIEDTEAYDTPMRKLIRYMPTVTLWLLEKKLTRVIGGPWHHTNMTIYDYEFYEDMLQVKRWYTQGTKLPIERKRCSTRMCTLGIGCIFGCCFSSQKIDDVFDDDPMNERELPYTKDSYTLVRNHPLFLISLQNDCPELLDHPYNVQLIKSMFRTFGTFAFALAVYLYLSFVGVFTAFILSGTHPQHFYEIVNTTMTLDLGTCEQVARNLSANPTIYAEALQTPTYQRLKVTLYIILWLFIAKNIILVLFLFPKLFRSGYYYLEISALVLSFVYTYDWYDWMSPVIMRCPIHYQVGAMGLLLAWVNILSYVRCSPYTEVGVGVAMLQVISLKFLRFLPVLMIIICGFGFTYWMLLQNQAMYGTPIEALLRTTIMLFDLGYDARLYSDFGAVAYYKLVYVIMILTTICICIFVINLLIGLAVGEIPTLMMQGKQWRSHMFYNLISDYEILRLQFIRLFDFLARGHLYEKRKNNWLCVRRRPRVIIEDDTNKPNCIKAAWAYISKYFFEERIQDYIIVDNKAQDYTLNKESTELYKITVIKKEKK